jgi:hypothetical protein
MTNDILGKMLSGEYTDSQTTVSSTTATATTERERGRRRLSHAERMAQIEADYQTERAQIMAERAQIEAEHREKMAQLQRESDEVDRIQAECAELHRRAKAALAAGNLDEMNRLTTEAFNKTMSLIKRH